MLIRRSGNFRWQNYFVTPPVITLNGVEQRDCIEVDDEAGYIIRYRREGGQLVVLQGRAQPERVDGKVIITGQRKVSPEEHIARAETKRDRRAIKRAEIARRQQICGE